MNNYDEFVNERKKKTIIPKNLSSKIKPFHIVLIIALIFMADQYVRKNGTSNWVIFIIAIVIGLYIFSMKEHSEGKPIPRKIAQEIARRDLIFETNPYRSYVHGTKVMSTGYYKDQTWDSGEGPKLFKYNLGFKIKEPGKAEKEIIYQMHPYTGECKGIIDSITGWKGEDVKDIQIVLPEKMVKDEKK